MRYQWNLTWWSCVFVGVIFCSRAYALNLDKLKVYFLKGDYKSAISEGEKALANSGNSSQSAELYYILGLSYLKEGNYLRACDIFEIIINEFISSPFKERAKLGLGDAYFLKGNFNKAKEYYEQLTNGNSNAKLKAELYYRLSQVGLKTGDVVLAKEYLDKLKQEVPGDRASFFNKDLIIIREVSSDFYYTVQVGAFSSQLNARNLCSKLTEKGFDAYIEETALKDTKTYRVRVGKMKLRPEAVQLENKLSQSGYPAKIFP